MIADFHKVSGYDLTEVGDHVEEIGKSKEGPVVIKLRKR
jgi:hypothetical protein